MTQTADLRTLIEGFRRKHYECEDCWYSCPKSEGGCCDDAQTGCTCGADAHNKRVEEALAHIDSLRAGE